MSSGCRPPSGCIQESITNTLPKAAPDAMRLQAASDTPGNDRQQLCFGQRRRFRRRVPKTSTSLDFLFPSLPAQGKSR